LRLPLRRHVVVRTRHRLRLSIHSNWSYTRPSDLESTCEPCLNAFE